MRGILTYGLTAVLYLALAVHFWRTRWRTTTSVAEARGSAPATVPAGAAGQALAWERWAILVPFLLHSALLFEAIFASPQLRFGFGHALSATLWLAVLVYWFESLFYPLEGMQPVILGVAALCVPLPAIFAGLEMPAYSHTLQFRLHLVLAMIAYGLFTIAALQAALMGLVEKRLHGRGLGEELSGPLASLPPLLTLETLLFRILGGGFVLLTLTLATGIMFSETLFGQAFRFNHKSLFAVLSWAIFGSLLAGRRFYGWRGRRALRWTMAGFVALLLAYVGSRFVLEVILGRSLV
ncbi:MAG: cytochrome c biogenesis protein CcsA [Burkholderiales bacterium]|nr:cytochrome c biogenesis protein CcsA [Burkholderiales bacterium]